MIDIHTAILQVSMSFLGSLGFSVLFNVRGKKVLLAALGGGISWAIFLLLADWIPEVPYRYFCCACFVATYSEVLARILKTPVTTFLIPSMIPHIPGSALYKTMRFALNKEWMTCAEQAYYTFKLALALALGSAVILTVFNVIRLIRRRSKE